MANPIAEFFQGTPAQTTQLPRFAPNQQNALNQVLSMALSGLQNNNFSFDPIANLARTNFQTQTVPGIAEQFTAAGGGQRSSAFAGALGSAASGLEQQLAALRSNYNMNQQNQLQDLLKTGLTPSFENIYMPQQGGFLQGAAGGLGQSLPMLLAMLGQYLSSNNASTSPTTMTSSQNTPGGTGFRNTIKSLAPAVGAGLNAFGPYGALAGAGVNAISSFL